MYHQCKLIWDFSSVCFDRGRSVGRPVLCTVTHGGKQGLKKKHASLAASEDFKLNGVRSEEMK